MTYIDSDKPWMTNDLDFKFKIRHFLFATVVKRESS